VFPSALADLEPVVEQLLARHLSSAREWFPHDLVPWELGGAIVRGQPWEPRRAGWLTDGVRSAILVNLLTEDNLPYYTRALGAAFGTEGPWGAWLCRWTAEEGRHAIALRDWVTVSQILDPVLLERGRMQQVSGGVAPEPWSAAGTLIYVTLQELATRVAHFNTGKAVGDPAGYEIMKRVAADENLHFLFYRDLSKVAVDLQPSEMVLATERVVRGFAMPGVGIEGFAAHTAAIGHEGIYNLAVYHDQVLAPTLRFWRVEELTGLDAESSRARDRLQVYTQRLCRIAQRQEQQRLEWRAAAPAGD
jgi:acyl-[acyl-carrier-protein] desaturase